jgi:hypothetical protein
MKKRTQPIFQAMGLEEVKLPSLLETQSEKVDLAAHTPTPWNQKGMYFDSNGLRLIGRTIQMKGKDLKQDEAEQDLAYANAAFIVRCVNSHEANMQFAQDVADILDLQKDGNIKSAMILEALQKRWKAIAQAEKGE